MMIKDRLADASGFEEVPSELDEALAIVPSYAAEGED